MLTIKIYESESEHVDDDDIACVAQIQNGELFIHKITVDADLNGIREALEIMVDDIAIGLGEDEYFEVTELH